METMKTTQHEQGFNMVMRNWGHKSQD